MALADMRELFEAQAELGEGGRQFAERIGDTFPSREGGLKKMVKFTHMMVKFQDVEHDEAPEKAILIAMRRVRLEDMDRDLINYDTLTDEGEHFPLPPKGDYLLLVFFDKTFCNKVFPTFRRWTPQKEKYYASMLDKIDEVKVGKEV